MSYNDLIQIDATMVANEFLDKYMPSANGDYVKVYLYLLRNRVNAVDVESIAEHLELTEGDVRRAIKYWEKCGIVSVGTAGSQDEKKTSAAGRARSAKTSASSEAETDLQNAATASDTVDNKLAVDESGEIRNRYRRAEGREAVNRLSSDSEFKQLLFIVQTYRSKILTEQEVQVFAYLYDGLHLPCDVLDYLVQYCVDSNHNNIRYIEKTGLDWANVGIKTVQAAKQRTKSFEAAREEGSRKKSIKKDKAGITRDKDLDEWLNQVVQRNIQ